jgi:hypothetical protein
MLVQVTQGTLYFESVTTHRQSIRGEYFLSWDHESALSWSVRTTAFLQAVLKKAVDLAHMPKANTSRTSGYAVNAQALWTSPLTNMELNL